MKDHPSTPPIMTPDVAPHFAADGPLTPVIPGYTPRPGQVALSQRMAEGIMAKEHVIAEAGCGVGKSQAYLMAIAATGVKAIVSTHTKALQSQLATQDIPYLQSVFPDVTWAVLKGRQNYACLEAMARVEAGESQDDLFSTSATAQEYQRLTNWLVADGQHGDLDQLPFPISEELRQRVTIDGYGCLGRKCPFISRCYSQQAKEKAQAAQIVIVNHAILLLDLYLGKSVGLLPQHPVIVFDEAHTLEDVATSTFGVELTSGRWRSIERKLGHLATDLQHRLSGTLQGELILDYVTSATGHMERLTPQAEMWFERILVEMGTAKTRLVDGVLHEALLIAGHELIDETQSSQRQVRQIAERLRSGIDEADQLDAERWLKLEDLMNRTVTWLEIGLSAEQSADTPMVRYIERIEGRSSRASLHVKPVRVHTLLADYLWSERTVLATSATLATGRTVGRGEDPFTYWRGRVGVEQARTSVIPSPFPYATATRLYLPANGKPFDPTWQKDREAQARYRATVLDEMAALLQVRRGGVFVLCTSFAMLRAAEAHLREGLPASSELYVQGDLPPVKLIERFKADGHGVLIGTRTFWEGVDVPGEALSMIIIDKLPFGVPDDPLWEARCRDVGEDWFRELALPTTLIALKQGAGRLMRRMEDSGVIAILDGRLRTRSYGKWIIAGLPPSPLIGEVKEVQQFFRVSHPRQDSDGAEG